MLAGLSAGRPGAGFKPVGRSIEDGPEGRAAAPSLGTARRSRHCEAAGPSRLDELVHRSLLAQRFLVVMLDGSAMGEHLLVDALDIRDDGLRGSHRRSMERDIL